MTIPTSENQRPPSAADALIAVPSVNTESEREKMARLALKNLSEIIGDPQNRLRSGIVLAHTEQLPRLSQIATVLNWDSVDYQQKRDADSSRDLSANSGFSTVTADAEIMRLQHLSRTESARNTTLLYNTDTMLASLPVDERAYFWHGFTELIVRPRRGLIIALSLRATEFLPSAALQEMLSKAGRLAALPVAL
jgi:hypothetical protein